MGANQLPVRFLYGTGPGRLLLRLILRTRADRLAVTFLRSPLSRPLIRRYIRTYEIPPEELAGQPFRTFHDFFIRRRETSFDPLPDHLISPCDGWLSAVPVQADSRFRIKGSSYTLEDLTGVKWRYGVPDTEGHVKAEWNDGTPFEGDTWFEMSDNCGEDTLVRVTAGHSAFENLSLVTCRKVGKGRVILLGAIPSEKDAARLIGLACQASGVKGVSIEGDVMAAPRAGDAGEGLMLVEFGGKDAAVTLPSPMTDLLTGRRLEGRVELKPYDVLVLKR